MAISTDQRSMLWILALLAGVSGFGAGIGAGPSLIGFALVLGGLGLAALAYSRLTRLAKS